MLIYPAGCSTIGLNDGDNPLCPQPFFFGHHQPAHNSEDCDGSKDNAGVVEGLASDREVYRRKENCRNIQIPDERDERQRTRPFPQVPSCVAEFARSQEKASD